MMCNAVLSRKSTVYEGSVQPLDSQVWCLTSPHPCHTNGLDKV